MEPLGDWVDVAPWKSRHVLLIGVDDLAHPVAALTLADKKHLLAASPHLLAAVWSGQWSTTARRFTTAADVRAVAKLLA